LRFSTLSIDDRTNCPHEHAAREKEELEPKKSEEETDGDDELGVKMWKK
jgi:hypothetical protein